MDPTSDETRRTQIVQSIVEFHTEYGSGPKFTDTDVQNEPDLIDAALEYLSLYTGTFAFLTDLKQKSRGNLSIGQARGVLNTILADHRRATNPISDDPITGIVHNGFYAMNDLVLDVRPWRDDGTRMIRMFNPSSNHWDAFASINPNSTYRIWGRTNSEHIRTTASAFFGTSTENRAAWSLAWSARTGKCFSCGNLPALDNGMCENCGTGVWATTVIRESQPQAR